MQDIVQAYCLCRVYRVGSLGQELFLPISVPFSDLERDNQGNIVRWEERQ